LSADGLIAVRLDPPDAAAWIDRLAGITERPARHEFFLAEPAAHHAGMVEQLQAGVLRLAHVDVERAERLAEAALWLADLLNDDTVRAWSLRCTGHVRFAQGRNSEAVEHYHAALDVFESIGQELDAGRTCLSILQPLIYLGRYDEAFQSAERAQTIFERHGDHLRLARLASNMGNILYRLDRHAEALEHYEKAHETLIRLGEPRDVAAVLSNMAVCCTSLGQFRSAFAHYEEARDHCVRHDLPLLVAAADYNIAYLHYLRGDYINAMRLYGVSRAHAQQANDVYHASLCDLDESEMCLELNLSEEAAQLAGQAAARFEALGMNYERAKAVVNQALAAGRGGDLGGSLSLLRQARKLFEREGNEVWPALIDLYQAILRYQQGRYADARLLTRRASRFLSQSPMHGKAASCELLQAQLLWKEGKANQAAQACRRILNTLDPDAAPSLRFHVSFVLGQIEEDLGDWEAAWNAHQSARQEIEDLRSRLWGDELKISILKDKLEVYEALVWLALWRRPFSESALREAFLLVEQAKSRSLADQIAFPWVPMPAQAREVDERIQEIRRDLNWHYRQIELAALLARSGFPAQVESLRERARAHEERLVRSLSESRAAGPSTEAPDKFAPLDLEEIRASIPADAVLLEYYQVRGVLYVCALGREKLRILPLAPAAQVAESLRLLQFQLSKFRLGAEYQRRFSNAMLSASLRHLEKLHGELLAPIRGLLNAKHLIIAPHSFLHNLPFHALRDGNRFLIDEFSISYAPSASVYSLCSGRQGSFRQESLVMGIPDQSAPHIEREARFAASMLPGSRLYLGPDATEAALREHGPRSRFVHIATHGLFRRDNPMFSSIRLGDSHISLLDLYQIPLSAELVTLSGCSTGLNAVVGGDELVGLMRGLLHAGAQGILVSLWDVQDQSTAEFMTVFYKQLQCEENKAEALRAAMRELRAEFPHPYHWAPFVLVGKYDS
jgi:CHAT domain-containing protein